MNEQLDALAVSVRRLREIVEPLDDEALVAPAHPTEWTIAHVLSHLGSAAVIMRRRLEDGLAGTTMPDDFPPAVWDEWNAKSPREQADDGLAEDSLLLAACGAVSDEARETFTFSMGPINADFAGFIGLRVNEHAFHTWDIDVALNPDAVLPPEVAAVVIDQLDLVARYTAKPTGEVAAIGVRTSNPAREFTVELAPESVALKSGLTGDADLELPAEAFARLVYGRFDGDSDVVTTLRRVFPGP